MDASNVIDSRLERTTGNTFPNTLPNTFPNTFPNKYSKTKAAMKQSRNESRKVDEKSDYSPRRTESEVDEETGMVTTTNLRVRIQPDDDARLARVANERQSVPRMIGEPLASPVGDRVRVHRLEAVGALNGLQIQPIGLPSLQLGLEGVPRPLPVLEELDLDLRKSHTAHSIAHDRVRPRPRPRPN